MHAYACLLRVLTGQRVLACVRVVLLETALWCSLDRGRVLVGSSAMLAEQKAAARRPSIIRTQPKVSSLYEGAAGNSSKQSFFNSDWARGYAIAHPEPESPS